MISINPKIGRTNVSFNPSFYKAALKNYHLGIYRDLIALMESSEQDAHVAGCLLGRRAGFLREWRLTEASDSAQDLAAKDFVESVFMSLDMRELFEDVQEARLKKFVVINLHWDVANNKQVITKAEKLNQRYFRYDNDGALKIDFGDKDPREIPTDAALVCETSRMPVLLPVLRDYILKEFGLESWASFIEQFGEPMLIGKYPIGASAELKSELSQALLAMAGSSVGRMPGGTEMEPHEAKRNTGDHEKFVANADQSIAVAILGHANAVERSQGTQIGENLESYKVKREIAVGDIYQIEQAIYRLVRILVDRNFG